MFVIYIHSIIRYTYFIHFLIISILVHYSLVASKTEEELVQRKTSNFGEVNLQEFARILRLNEKEPTTQQLFRIHDRVRT